MPEKKPVHSFFRNTLQRPSYLCVRSLNNIVQYRGMRNGPATLSYISCLVQYVLCLYTLMYPIGPIFEIFLFWDIIIVGNLPSSPKKSILDSNILHNLVHKA